MKGKKTGGGAKRRSASRPAHGKLPSVVRKAKKPRPANKSVMWIASAAPDAVKALEKGDPLYAVAKDLDRPNDAWALDWVPPMRAALATMAMPEEEFRKAAEGLVKGAARELIEWLLSTYEHLTALCEMMDGAVTRHIEGVEKLGCNAETLP
jgi:hypothetical protein